MAISPIVQPSVIVSRIAFNFDQAPLVWRDGRAAPTELLHLHSKVCQPDKAAGRFGYSVWYLPENEADLEVGLMPWLGWDWVEVRDGVLALLDPLSLVSNIAFDGKNPKEDLHRTVILNEWLHKVPWQCAVSAALETSH